MKVFPMSFARYYVGVCFVSPDLYVAGLYPDGGEPVGALTRTGVLVEVSLFFGISHPIARSARRLGRVCGSERVEVVTGANAVVSSAVRGAMLPSWSKVCSISLPPDDGWRGS